MSLISDKYQNEKLNNLGVNIKSKYIVGNRILEKNTDESINDDITNGILMEKQYFLNNNLIHTEKYFDSRMEYTFISNENMDNEYVCPNCGIRATIKDFKEGCPYCKTFYNLDYTNKALGNKQHYDYVLRNKSYRVFTAILDIAVSLLLSYLFIRSTSRTFNDVDKTKIFIYGFILALILYYFFYIVDAYIILGPIKKYKEKLNQRQIDFWNRTKIDKKKFFNNLNFEIRKLYYEKPNVIDYDILDYLSFEDFKRNEKKCVKVTLEIRVVRLIDGKIQSKISKESYVLNKHEGIELELKDGINIMKCEKCGASIDATKEHCDYCGNEVNHLLEWTIE